ncbi:MAG: hypothetical protein ACRDRX_14340 [Pseudonocardiaceae bacterium]
MVGISSSGMLNARTFGSTGESCLPWIGTVEHCSAAMTVRSEYTDDFFATGSIGHSTPHQAEQVLWQQQG